MLDTSSITVNPINLRLHSNTIQNQLNTPCLGNLSTQILAFDTTKNLFDVYFSFWVVSDTKGSALIFDINGGFLAGLLRNIVRVYIGILLILSLVTKGMSWFGLSFPLQAVIYVP